MLTRNMSRNRDPNKLVSEPMDEKISDPHLEQDPSKTHQEPRTFQEAWIWPLQKSTATETVPPNQLYLSRNNQEQLDKFLDGLREEVRYDVVACKPVDLREAVSLANLFEDKWLSNKKKKETKDGLKFMNQSRKYGEEFQKFLDGLEERVRCDVVACKPVDLRDAMSLSKLFKAKWVSTKQNGKMISSDNASQALTEVHEDQPTESQIQTTKNQIQVKESGASVLIQVEKTAEANFGNKNDSFEESLKYTKQELEATKAREHSLQERLLKEITDSQERYQTQLKF